MSLKTLLASLVVLTCAASLNSVRAQNQFPVVLVHGLAGWGRSELDGYKYWGGRQGDLEQKLRAKGFNVLTATVGPFASNWDRACDLYAQIKGGQVNYGPRHSKHYGHKQFGRTFDGLFPEWGSDVNGTIQKVHLMGHSMGGQTIRMLTQMLNKGTKGAPVEEDALSHPLFGGGLDWVESVTTISSPNQGTLLADMIYKDGDLFESAVSGVLAFAGVGGNKFKGFFDAKLDQWGLDARRENERLSAYVKRVVHSGLFKPGFQDTCGHSLSTYGAAEENAWVETLSNVFYYSFANKDSFTGFDLLFRRVDFPNLLTMMLPLQATSLLLGGRYGPERGFSEAWQPNDGLVSVESMRSDGIGETVTFDGESARGRWHEMPFLNRMDHGAIIGIGNKRQPVVGMYASHLQMLQNLPLPSDPPRRRHLRVEEDASSHPLFGGGLDWVESVTTISSPNHGTLLANMIYDNDDFYESAASAVLAFAGVGGHTTKNFFDAKLDQWGLEVRGDDETLLAYVKRIMKSSLFNPGFHDTCGHSTSTFGAAEENAWVKTLPNVFYYSYSNKDSYRGIDLFFRRVEYPNLMTMLLPLHATSLLLGSRYAVNHGFGEEWQPNDGLVSVASMRNDGSSEIVTFNGSSVPGRWHEMPLLDRMDHGAVIGIGNKRRPVLGIYEKHLKMLKNLPLPSEAPQRRFLRSKFD
ncbi:TPA: hypothetical protein N0F65_001350 [Lagenidium giganteum]|uniref:Lipase-like C-terminal domain-containing protein n=1 Tax=Lagenidium giganteum TaxID=4803 RepID=A0AAV2YX35_9STRA|nr:TPA: hypothetical protein N0F65_001350 [Lagenidium giganteum]